MEYYNFQGSGPVGKILSIGLESLGWERVGLVTEGEEYEAGYVGVHQGREHFVFFSYISGTGTLFVAFDVTTDARELSEFLGLWYGRGPEQARIVEAVQHRFGIPFVCTSGDTRPQNLGESLKGFYTHAASLP